MKNQELNELSLELEEKKQPLLKTMGEITFQDQTLYHSEKVERMIGRELFHKVSKYYQHPNGIMYGRTINLALEQMLYDLPTRAESSSATGAKPLPSRLSRKRALGTKGKGNAQFQDAAKAFLSVDFVTQGKR